MNHRSASFRFCQSESGARTYEELELGSWLTTATYLKKLLNARSGSPPIGIQSPHLSWAVASKLLRKDHKISQTSKGMNEIKCTHDEHLKAAELEVIKDSMFWSTTSCICMSIALSKPLVNLFELKATAKARFCNSTNSNKTSSLALPACKISTLNTVQFYSRSKEG